ncbi:hypothetical protein HOLleu_15946 [Holothuria leucospilota]|uniref:Uncharacterized protein n=1 Tax=Holothuria leucospilota TaxID=206669 RepID=A0A9Q1H7G8_HOLLE|nr:hypothetical protein HOLleu_15946 [Holothuria leucospilota]
MDLKVIASCILLMIPLGEASPRHCLLCGGQHADTEAQLVQVRETAVQWMADQQTGDGRWPNVNTQKAILGLQLANYSWLANQELNRRRLTKSRLEYELLGQLLPERRVITLYKSPLSSFCLIFGVCLHRTYL